MLKRSYGCLVSDQIRLGINHIDKTEFLPLFKQAQIKALSERNIQKQLFSNKACTSQS
jgi:hypothetical protein